MNAFGILSTKLRVFRWLIIAKPSKVTKVVQAACVLHNYLKITEALLPPSFRYYCPSGYIDQEDRQEMSLQETGEVKVTIDFNQ